MMDDRGNITDNHQDHVHVSFVTPGPIHTDLTAVSPWSGPPPAQEDDAMSVTVLDTKHPGTPSGRVRFVRLKISPGQFQLVSFNGAKIAGFTLPHTQHSNGAVLGVEPEPDGVHFVVTADDGGTFRYSFAP